uniref:JmjC domain-containing protein n=1 Tax=Odontella aurita TaxID=265563 RepID=A0A7S4IRS9_9STRA|mmetsp:Transcript_29293/g.86772  ORF Transcript_29293/g.86772 Transcript_29293/m.86772 type:complete len:690 (+) Transcript_29293:99-2168(+)
MSSRQRRRRKPTHAFHAAPHSNEEERAFQQAVANSRLDRFRPRDHLCTVPAGPTFYPTVEEFEGNPLHYIEKIRPIAEKYGICKIVPPAGWNPPFSVDMNETKKFQTKEQLIHRLQEGIAFGDGDDYCASDYLKMARKRALEWRAKCYYGETVEVETGDSSATGETDGAPVEHRENMTPAKLEQQYWDIVETHAQDMAVEYGNDVDSDRFGSGFPISERGRSVNSDEIDVDKADLPEPKFGTDDFYKETYWNLNNIPNAPDSILRHIKVGINGINVPWLYFGCLFSTFCWHNEDNYMYSINYAHWGAPKQWYGVPGTRKDAEGLERVFKNYLSMKMRDVPDLLHHITTMFSPRLLQQGGVPVYKILQRAGEFVVTFPRAFHGGFSYGPNCGEAVNFATHDWISQGADANERYRSFARPSVFSHDRLTFTMSNHLKDQKRYSTCRLLLAELQRVVEEELKLRNKLLDAGVRDVSGDINLPRNRLDQLDEESADYDDKRLCHACKHVCFFSCVACECSQTKVSCLRHSHYMCRCPTERKYMMIWSTEDEMNTILRTVKNFAEELKLTANDDAPDKSAQSSSNAKADKDTSAPGSGDAWDAHKDIEIDLSPILPAAYPLTGGPSVAKEGAVTNDISQDPTELEFTRDPKRIKMESDDARVAAETTTSTDAIASSDGDEVVFVETKNASPVGN